MPVDMSSVVPTNAIVGEDAEDTALLQTMEKKARIFLLSQSWCDQVKQSFFGCGIGGIVAVFLLRIEPVKADVDEWLWVVVGDLPSAYLVTDQATFPTQAMRIYIDLMQEWVHAVHTGTSLQDVYPVDVPPTNENATALATRLDMLMKLDICGCGNQTTNQTNN